MPFSPIPNGWRAVTDGDLIYGLVKPRDAFWKTQVSPRRGPGKDVYIIEQFFIINGDTSAYSQAPDTALQSFRNALTLHDIYKSAVPAGTPSKVPPTGQSEAKYNEDVRRKDKGGLDWAVKSANPGRHVHFLLDDLNMSQVVGKTSPGDEGTGDGKMRGITGAELRWIYRNRHRADVQQRIQFWLSEVTYWRARPTTPPIPTSTLKQSVPPWDNSYTDTKYPPAIWAAYTPKVH